jgi:signal transduction histidine kinase
MSILVIVLSVMFIYMVYRYIVIIRQLNKVCAILDYIKDGNYNRKFLLRGNASVVNLCACLNNFLERYKNIDSRKCYLEQLRIRMITDISHDIRTPLTALLGYVEALSKDSSLTEQEKLSYLNIVNEKGIALYTMMDDFFELTKLDENQELKLEKIEITEKVRHVMTTFYYDFIKENIKLELNLPEELIYAYGDDKCIERVLMNLVSNSLRYGKAGGVIGINVSEHQDRVWFEVWDRGGGISEKNINFVFERLFSAEGSRNYTLRGSGLGLSIVKELVVRMKGDITVTSLPDEKTVFTFYLTKIE